MKRLISDQLQFLGLTSEDRHRLFAHVRAHRVTWTLIITGAVIMWAGFTALMALLVDGFVRSGGQFNHVPQAMGFPLTVGSFSILFALMSVIVITHNFKELHTVEEQPDA